jgi:hypothetical protein
VAFGWSPAFRLSRWANERFATRATLFPNLFQKFGKGLLGPTYRKVLGEWVAAVANPWAASVPSITDTFMSEGDGAG